MMSFCFSYKEGNFDNKMLAFCYFCKKKKKNTPRSSESGSSPHLEILWCYVTTHTCDKDLCRWP